MKSYPAPLEIAALGGEKHHTHTFILLHGRGSNAERFGRELLSSTLLAMDLPTIKFVFPTACKRRSTILKRSPINQWYDNYSLEDPGLRTELQIDGLAETAQFLRKLIEHEASILGGGEEGYKRVLLGGLSQGCAAGLFALLGGLVGEYRLGAFVGMSGWLPFQRQIDEILKMEKHHPISKDEAIAKDKHGTSESSSEAASGSDVSEGSDEDDTSVSAGDSELDDDDQLDSLSVQQTDDDTYDPFGSQSEDGSLTHEQDAELSRVAQALNHIRDILDLLPLATITESSGVSGQPMSYLKTPVFLGHGALDPKVSVKLGEAMAKTLATGFGIDVTWRAYEDLGHWYKIPDEIDDVLEFVRKHANLAP